MRGPSEPPEPLPVVPTAGVAELLAGVAELLAVVAESRAGMAELLAGAGVPCPDAGTPTLPGAVVAVDFGWDA